MALTTQQWKDTGLLPRTGWVAWNKYSLGSTDGVCYDFSDAGGNSISQLTTPPILTFNVINGKPGWHFDGTKNPLVGAAPITFKHLFILATYDDATFNPTLAPGLVTDNAVWHTLAGSNGGTAFANLNAWGGAAFLYRKDDVSYPLAGMAAPMSGQFALIEVQIPSGVTLGSLQIGGDGIVLGKWKGYFVEDLIYNRILTTAERQRIMLYFNLEFQAFQNTSLPLYFPSDDFMNFKRRRFYAEPPEYDKITNSYEFEDGGKTFNETSDDAPRRWEYVYKLVNNGASTDPPEVQIFDEFYATVRLSQTFNFTDKYGTVWDNVRVESYDRTHEAHKPWIQTIRFRLIRYPS